MHNTPLVGSTRNLKHLKTWSLCIFKNSKIQFSVVSPCWITHLLPISSYNNAIVLLIGKSYRKSTPYWIQCTHWCFVFVFIVVDNIYICMYIIHIDILFYEYRSILKTIKFNIASTYWINIDSISWYNIIIMLYVLDRLRYT